MARDPRAGRWLLLALVALAASLPLALACRDIGTLTEAPAAVAEPAARIEAAAPEPPPAPATGGADLNAATLVGPVFPSLIGVHSTFCDPATEPYGCL